MKVMRAAHEPVIRPYVTTRIDQAEVLGYYARARRDVAWHEEQQHPDGSLPSDCRVCLMLQDHETRWGDLVGDLAQQP